MVYFRAKEKNAVALPRSAQRKHGFWGEIKQMSKTKKLAPRKKFALEYKIQLVNYKLSPKFPLGHSSLPDIRAIYAYIFWSLLLSHYLCDTRLPILLKHT